MFGFDHRTRASAAQGRVLWLAGHPDQALKIARQPIDETEKIYHPVNACVTMLSSAQVLMWCGFLDEAQQRVERMVAHAARHSLHTSHAIALALEGELAVARGQPDVGVDLLQPALHTLSTERHFLLATYFLRALAEGLLQCGQVDAALVKIDEAMARAEAQGDTFDKPELMRVRACILLAMEPGDTMAAGQLLAAALAHARSQAAHGLELRTAITLASLWRSHHRDDDARRLLTGVYMRFTEGYETADLKTAAALLDELGRL